MSQAFKMQAKNLIDQGNYEVAMTVLDEALETHGNEFDTLIEHSICRQRLKQYELAIYHDLYLALNIAKEETKSKDQTAQVYFRLAVNYFKLKHFEDSLKFLKLAQQFGYQPSNELVMWFAQLESKLHWDQKTWKFFNDLMLADDNIVEELREEAKQKIGKVPELKKKFLVKNNKLSSDAASTSLTVSNKQSNNTSYKKTQEPIVDKTKSEKQIKIPTQTVVAANSLDSVVYPLPEQLRKDFFQSSKNITVSFYIKKVPKDTFEIYFQQDSMSFKFKMDGNKEYIYSIPKLYSEIVPDECSYTVFGTKVEVILAKKTPSTWKELEGKKLNERSNDGTPAEGMETENVADNKVVYPSSSTKKIDWDKLDKELNDETIGDEDDEADPSMALFRQIYKDADDNTRRAMQKSFVESNGTTLSTNWDEVGKAPVKVSPPDGMEAKLYES